MTATDTFSPADADAHYRQGQARFRANDLNGAVAAYTAALRLRPDYADALSNRGAARAALGDRRGAFADYDAALAANPNLASALNNRGVARFLAGDLHAALADLQAAIRIDPSYAAAYDNCAAVHGNLVEHAQAVASYGRAIELYEADPRQTSRQCTARVLRALALYHLHQQAAALADLRAAYRLDPRLCAFTVAAAIEGDARGHAAQALAACDRYLARDPADFFTIVRRGLTNLVLGHRAAFEADYDAALWAPVSAEDLTMGLAFLKTLEERLAASP